MTEIVESDGILGGKPCVNGTRVSSEQIYEMHTEKGMKPEAIADVIPTVDLDGVKAAIEYKG